MKTRALWCMIFSTSILVSLSTSFAQSLGTAGTVHGVITDPARAVVPGALVEIHNPVTGYDRTAKTDDGGEFQFADVPFNPYHLNVSAPGFQIAQRDVDVRTSVPIDLKITLRIATTTTTVTVESHAQDILETTAIAHTDVDRSLISKLPIENQSIGLSEVLTMTSPGVVADANGFFHPLGDHAQASLSLDNQPISDQYSKLFSNQLALNTIESMEVISGTPPAEYGDKTSLVVNTITRSGLGKTRPTGDFSALYGSFGTWTENFDVGVGGKRWGNFLAANSSGSGRFLDSPEFTRLHDRGNAENIFDRIDYQPTTADTLHLNLSLGRSWFQTPNTFDQNKAGQDQRSQIRSLNIAPGWTHLFSSTTLLTVNPFYRLDRAQYFPTRTRLADLPATLSQSRRLNNAGVRADVSYSRGKHNAKFGVQFWHTLLTEGFDLGVTDPLFNAICVDSSKKPILSPGITDPDNCADGGFQANPDFAPGLLAFDLTRGGRIFGFSGHTDIKEAALYLQDTVTLGRFTINGGIRADRYNGLSRARQIEPRAGVAYLIKRTNTVLRASYARTLETPYNENLILSSSTGAGGLASNAFGGFGQSPIQAGRRNQFNAGIQQAFGRWVVLDGDYFYKRTRFAYDFDTLFSTPIAFPISWRKSKIDGVSARVNLTNIRGFSAFMVLGHNRARFFGPENGGLIFNSPINASVFRIDHDQAFQQSTNVRYQYKKNGPWVAFTWRYDSGLVAGRVPDFATALTLTGDQQAQIGLFCGSTFATVSQPLTACISPNRGATRVRIPAPGTGSDDTNPPRIESRHLFDIGTGIDNLFRTDRYRVTLRLLALNLTNKVALYNFLSTFSGTHFVTPRAWQAELGFVF